MSKEEIENILNEYRKAYKKVLELDDEIQFGLLTEEEKKKKEEEKADAEQKAEDLKKQVPENEPGIKSAEDQALQSRKEDLEAIYEAAYYNHEDGMFTHDKEKEKAGSRQLIMAEKMLTGRYYTQEEFESLRDGIKQGYIAQKKEEKKQEGQEQAGEAKGESSETEAPANNEQGANNPEQGTVVIPKEKQEIIDGFVEKFGESVATYINVTTSDVKNALEFYLKETIGGYTQPIVARDRTLRDHAENLASRAFKRNIAKQNLQDAFSDILSQAETKLSASEMETLKTALYQKLQEALDKEYNGTLGKGLSEHKSDRDSVVKNLEQEKKELQKDKKLYEENPTYKDGENAKPNLEKIGYAMAIIQAVEDARSDLWADKRGLVGELQSADRKRESFKPAQKTTETETKEKTEEETKSSIDPLIQKFEDVKSTLFNPSVAAKITKENYKRTTGNDGKEVLIVHVENDGTRVPGGKVNKTRSTVVVTENSIRKISEYVATMSEEEYYKEVSGGQEKPIDFDSRIESFLGAEGIDMRPTNEDGSVIEEPKKEEVPMLSESLVETKTGMQQLVVNTPKGISAIAVGANKRALTYTQKQEIELFTEEQKAAALKVKDSLLTKYVEKLGIQVQDGVEVEGGNVSMVEQDFEIKKFFKILQAKEEDLAVGGTGNFKRDSSKENIVKQNFMTFVFDKSDENNTRPEDGKDPMPLQYTIVEREAGKDKVSTFILGIDGKYYDMELLENTRSKADLEGKGVDARVILNKAGTLGIGDKFVTNVMKRDTAKAIAEKAEDEKIAKAGLASYRVDGDKNNRHVNKMELSLHRQANYEADKAREEAEQAKNAAEAAKTGQTVDDQEKE